MLCLLVLKYLALGTKISSLIESYTQGGRWGGGLNWGEGLEWGEGSGSDAVCDGTEDCPGFTTPFTCSTSAKVQKLTPEELRARASGLVSLKEVTSRALTPLF